MRMKVNADRILSTIVIQTVILLDKSFHTIEYISILKVYLETLTIYLLLIIYKVIPYMFPVSQPFYKAGLIKSRSPLGMNSLIAPFAIHSLGLAQSNSKFLSANATFMRGLSVKASPLAACGA